MPTQRCEICRKAKMIEDKSICCSDCEEKELDLLVATFAFIHCYDSDFCPMKELIENVPAAQGTSLNHAFIKSWLMKNWLEKNGINSLRVPLALYKDLKDSGFSLGDVVRTKLAEQRKKRMPVDNVMEVMPKAENNVPRAGMVFIEKKNRD